MLSPNPLANIIGIIVLFVIIPIGFYGVWHFFWGKKDRDD